MARKTQIGKDIILQSALEMLIEKGYQEINIKTLSQKIGCSTQPLVWHFGNMDGLRKEIGEYALQYADKKQIPTSSGMMAFFEAGTAYVDIAFEEPNLFQYLYMSADSGRFWGGFDMITKIDGRDTLVSQVAAHLSISEEKTSVFCRNMILYTHGLASFVAAGLITAIKLEVHEMMRQSAEGFLLQINARLP